MQDILAIGIAASIVIGLLIAFFAFLSWASIILSILVIISFTIGIFFAK